MTSPPILPPSCIAQKQEFLIPDIFPRSDGFPRVTFWGPCRISFRSWDGKGVAARMVLNIRTYAST